MKILKRYVGLYLPAGEADYEPVYGLTSKHVWRKLDKRFKGKCRCGDPNCEGVYDAEWLVLPTKKAVLADTTSELFEAAGWTREYP